MRTSYRIWDEKGKSDFRVHPRYSWKRDESGVSGAITAMLVILILSGFLSILYTSYIPQWTKEQEAEQMNIVLEQFLATKETIDDQIINREENLNITVTNQITIGYGGGPVFGVGKTQGLLDVDPFHGNITIWSNDTGTGTNETYGWGRGNITFHSKNLEYVNQRFTYENGAVIISQEDRAVMKVDPHFYAEKDRAGDISMSMILPILVGDMQSIAGSGDVVVATTLQAVDTNEFFDWSTGRNITIDVITEFPDVWFSFFARKLANDTSGTGMLERNATNPTGDYNITNMMNIVTGENIGVRVIIYNALSLKTDIAIVKVDLR